MNRIVLVICLMIGLSSANALAEMTSGHGHRLNTSDENPVRPGKQIHEANLKGYTLLYYLLDSPERSEMMKMMGHHPVIGVNKSMEVTNHLMVYIEKPKGKAVPGDVAFSLTGPDGKDFKTMTVGMYGGYGADVIMKQKGDYAIKTRINREGGDAVQLEDEFIFQMK